MSLILKALHMLAITTAVLFALCMVLFLAGVLWEGMGWFSLIVWWVIGSIIYFLCRAFVD